MIIMLTNVLYQHLTNLTNTTYSSIPAQYPHKQTQPQGSSNPNNHAATSHLELSTISFNKFGFCVLMNINSIQGYMTHLRGIFHEIYKLMP